MPRGWNTCDVFPLFQVEVIFERGARCPKQGLTLPSTARSTLLAMSNHGRVPFRVHDAPCPTAKIVVSSTVPMDSTLSLPPVPPNQTRPPRTIQQCCLSSTFTLSYPVKQENKLALMSHRCYRFQGTRRPACMPSLRSNVEQTRWKPRPDRLQLTSRLPPVCSHDKDGESHGHNASFGGDTRLETHNAASGIHPCSEIRQHRDERIVLTQCTGSSTSGF